MQAEFLGELAGYIEGDFEYGLVNTGDELSERACVVIGDLAVEFFGQTPSIFNNNTMINGFT